MTADRIQYFEERLKKPIPEPFKSWMEELFAEATGNTKHVAVMVSPDGTETELGAVKPGASKINGRKATTAEVKRVLDAAPKLQSIRQEEPDPEE
jgi:hypothetical protein